MDATTQQGPVRMNNYGHKMDALNEREKPGERHAKCSKCGAVENECAATELCPYAEYVHISVLQSEVRKMADIGKGKSGKKIGEKIRQYYQREFNKNSQLEAQQIFKTFEEHLKPKPAFIPKVVFKLIQKMVIHL